MSFTREDRLYSLLPAIYRTRDAEQGEPLKALLSVIADQIAVLEEDLAQLYDDQFIETCADWVVPYIGDLIGHRTLHGITSQISSPRAVVANTIGYRRRKGTVAVLEQLARDVTGWGAHVVEFFQLLSTTQYMNHIRPANLYSPNLRQWEPLERLNTPFDSVAHTLDVRHIASGRGRYNIPNIGIFLWRLFAYSLTSSPASKLDTANARRYMFSPLGNNIPLFSRPQPEGGFTSLVTPADVAMPISRRVLDQYLDNYYGTTNKSLLLNIDGNDILPGPAQHISDLIQVCDLSDIKDASGNTTGWAHMPLSQGKIAIDPVLGRIALPPEKQNSAVRVTFYYGFSTDMGGGEYSREDSFTAELLPVVHVPLDPQQPSSYATIQDALNALNGKNGVVEITDSGRYEGSFSIQVNANQHIELRAADLHRPSLVLEAATGGGTVPAIQISGDTNSRVTLNGLLISAGHVQVSGDLGCLSLRHCTLVPGLSLSTDGVPQHPSQPSVVINASTTTVDINQCIIGGMQVAEGANVWITNSIVDATAQDNVAYAALDGSSAGAPVSIENCTIIGKVHTLWLVLASNTVFLANLVAGDTWTTPVLSDKRQEGCVRFTYLPLNSQVPRRYRCQPESSDKEELVRPRFTSLHYGHPGYCQLRSRCPVAIRQGADDESEMGAFHDLFQPQREMNLRVRLDEYLRFGLEAGIFYTT
jgi:hypothetical protein